MTSAYFHNDSGGGGGGSGGGMQGQKGNKSGGNGGGGGFMGAVSSQFVYKHGHGGSGGDVHGGDIHGCGDVHFVAHNSSAASTAVSMPPPTRLPYHSASLGSGAVSYARTQTPHTTRSSSSLSYSHPSLSHQQLVLEGMKVYEPASVAGGVWAPR